MNGVPQGSVLGPLCFTMYIAAPLEEVVASFDGVQLISYANDPQLYMVIIPLEKTSAISKLEQCINSVKSWMITNRLKLNRGKTEVLHITSKFLRQSAPTDTFVVGSDVTHTSSAVRNLELTFNKHFGMTTHINNVCRTANLALCRIGQIRKYLDQSTAEKLTHTFITSRLDYCNSLLFHLSDCEIAKLQRVQNAAARMVGRVKKYHHITPVLRQLHWLPVHKRILFKILLLTYKALHRLAPSYIAELLTTYKPIRPLRSSSQHLLKPATTSTSYGDRAFSAAASELWNELPMSIRCAKSLDVFKNLLKTHLFICN